MNIETLKSMLKITSDKHDTYLVEVLELFKELAKAKCNDTFSVDDVEELPAGVKLYIAKAIEHNMQPSTLKGRTMGSVSYTYNTEIPDSVTAFLKPYIKPRKISFK